MLTIRMLHFISPRNITNKSRSLILVLILLTSVIPALCSYFKIFGVGRDYETYKEIFDFLLANGCRNQSNEYIISNIEFGFQELTCFFTYFSSDYDLISAVEIFVSMFIKMSLLLILLAKSNLIYTDFLARFFAIFLIYITRYYPLHEFTQIRVSISIGFLFAATFCFKNISDFYFSLEMKNFKITNTRRLIILSCLLLIAFSFHYSNILVIPLIYVASRVQSRKMLVVSSLLIFAFFTFTSSLLVNGLGGMFFSERLYSGSFDKVNPFSVFKILDILSFLIAFILVDFSVPIQAFFLSLVSYSLVLFYSFLLANLPDVYSFRFSEILIVFNAFLIISIKNKSHSLIIASMTILTSIISLLFYINNNYFIPFSK